jgi:major membrane immunogen (membrane-anchored lipoprotein)
MKFSRLTLLSMFASSLLTSCQTSDFASRPTEVAPVGIDGEWVDTRGINTAKFGGGTFTSVDAKTGQTMARGSYTYRDQQNVDLAFTSLIRNTTVNAACLVVAQSQLNCTTSSGAKFSLVRRTANPTAAAPVPRPLPAGVPQDAVLVGET